ncbi:MAG: cache domain-containing protein [Gammaproteobacteria bacterium]|nr:cache domain-containing protein [Gammaproteobacteria bacterium]
MISVAGMMRTVGGTVRYKLLALVLFPILLVMPVALLIAIYWGATFSYDQLYIKVNTDLDVAGDVFKRIQKDYLNKLNTLGDSYTFRTALGTSDRQSIDEQLLELKNSSGFNYLRIIEQDSRLFYTQKNEGQDWVRSSSSLQKASQGVAAVGIEIFSSTEIRQLSETLANMVELKLIETPRARSTNRIKEDRAMMIRALYPVSNALGELVAILDGGVLLNENFEFVDAIRDLVYGPGSLPEGSIGTVTVFIDDVRISTNVPRKPGQRALGTRVSNEVRTEVLDHGNTWIDRAFVVNDWYISSYEPIIDIDGERVGMLYAGFLETPFRNALWRALTIFVLMFLLLMIISSLVAIWGAKSIFKPIESMSNVVKATRNGVVERIGTIKSHDEIGELAREFDAMLDLLHQRNQEIQSAADQLDQKVQDRTAELLQRNEDLQRTIAVLQETRQQLVHAEKLAALGELTAGVAHEINNPTAVMLGNLDILIDELGSDIGPVQEEIDLIVEQIYRIKDIIDNLLQYARPDEYAGYMTDVDVNELIRQTLKLIRHYQQNSCFEIRLQLDAVQRIKINQQELKQVIVNLLINAIHALDKNDGCIEISTRDWEQKGVVICIDDNGMGMTEEDLNSIFNPFFSTKQQGEGTGLGLSVSYSLIRRYGGNITAQSSTGKGSCFMVWLLSEPEPVEDELTIIEQLHAIEKEVSVKG